MEKTFVMLVDDDPMVLRALSSYLSGHEYRVEGYSSGNELLNALEEGVPDLIILDLKLPGMDGFQICQKLRSDERYARIPVIMLSGMAGEEEKVSGLDMGADDYVVKPFSPEELRSRIKAVLRRASGPDTPSVMNIDDILSIDRLKYEVRANGEPVDLTRTEFKILDLLVSRRGQVFSRERILDHLWGEEKVVIERTVDVHIRHLREKLGEAGDLIENVRGVGYRMKEAGS
jgi:two-component system phosphate regulon response regulator PhoB/two-component system alkaline phosphatase synthesis response regulator PhoP